MSRLHRMQQAQVLPLLNKIVAVSLVIALVALHSMVWGVRDANATLIQSASDTMTRQRTSTASSHDIAFVLSASEKFDTGETVIVDFNEDASGFTLDGASVTVTDLDFHDGIERTIVGVDGDCTGHSGTNDVAVTVNDAAGILTFTACDLFTGSGNGVTIDIEIGTAAGGTNRLTNPASAGSAPINFSGTFGDDAFEIAVPIMDSDQVSITANVSPRITFDLDVDDNAPVGIAHADSNTPYTIALGELVPTQVTSEATSGVSEIYVDLDTNADGGAVVQVVSTNAALISAVASGAIYSIDAPGGLSTSSASGGYGLASIQQAAATEGTLTPAAPFNVHGTAGAVGGLSTSFQTIFNTGSAPIAGGDGEVAVRAVAGSTTPAADDYTDTLTFIATATY